MRSELFGGINPQRRREIETEAIRARISAENFQSRHYLALNNEDASGPANGNSRSRSPADTTSGSRSGHPHRNLLHMSIQDRRPFRRPSPRPETPEELIPYDEARRRLLGGMRPPVYHWSPVAGRLRYFLDEPDDEEETMQRDFDAYFEFLTGQGWDTSAEDSLGHGQEGSSSQAHPDLDEYARSLANTLRARSASMAVSAGLHRADPATRSWLNGGLPVGLWAPGELRRRDSDEETLPPYSPPQEDGLEDAPPAYTPVAGIAPGGGTD
jgi:hypothetical protein